MPFLSPHLVWISLLLTINLVLGAALPKINPNPARSFTLQQTAVPRRAGWSQVLAMRRTFAKYAQFIPPQIEVAIKLASSSSSAASASAKSLSTSTSTKSFTISSSTNLATTSSTIKLAVITSSMNSATTPSNLNPSAASSIIKLAVISSSTNSATTLSSLKSPTTSSSTKSVTTSSSVKSSTTSSSAKSSSASSSVKSTTISSSSKISSATSSTKSSSATSSAKSSSATSSAKSSSASSSVKTSSAPASAETASAQAQSTFGDSEYLIKVGAGDQTFLLNLDTGSSDLWIFSTLQPAIQLGGRTSANIYQANSAKEMLGETWMIEYGDGSFADGLVYSDTVTVGDVSFPQQAVEAAIAVAQSFVDDTVADGLIGMAMSDINTVSPDQQNTFFDNIKAKLSAPLFTAALKHLAPGSYDFGFINPTKYHGSIIYTPVTDTGYWSFAPYGYAIGNGPVVQNTFQGGAIADTGTTLWYMPDDIVNAYWAQVSGAGFDPSIGAIGYPCGATLPSLSIVITKGSAPVSVPGYILNYGPYSATQCFGGLQSNDGMPFSIFGDIFFKGVFTIFDTSVPRLGFANQTGV